MPPDLRRKDPGMVLLRRRQRQTRGQGLRREAGTASLMLLLLRLLRLLLVLPIRRTLGFQPCCCRPLAHTTRTSITRNRHLGEGPLLWTSSHNGEECFRRSTSAWTLASSSSARSAHHMPLPRRRGDTTTTALRLSPISSSLGTTITLASTSAAAVAAETIHPSVPAYVAGAWSVFLMLVLVGLLTVWEQGVENFQRTLPKPLLPVINSVLGEMGGLGFIGLLLSTFVTNNVVGEWLERAGEATLQDSEILVETFEFLHTAFFQVGMTFFGVAALLVGRSLRQLAILDQVTEVAQSADNFNCLAALAESTSSSSSVDSAAALAVPPEFAASVSTEDLLVRERLVRQFDLDPAQFRVENYFGAIMGQTLEEFVELAPCTAWLPLIPALSQGRSIDMSHDVVSASSHNALASAGYFVSTPSFVAGTSIFAVLGAVWGGWNYWKMQEIKRMVLPAVVQAAGDDDSSTEESVRMVDPPYVNATQLADFDSSPSVFGRIEAAVVSTFFNDETQEEDNVTREDLDSRQGRQLRLFGRAGEAGPELYLRSIKFHTWLVTTQVVFWGTQIVARDLNAVSDLFVTGVAAGSSAEIGRPEYVVAELVLYGTFVGAALFQLLYLAPQTFWNYILVTSVEEFAKPELLRSSCCDIGILDTQKTTD